MATVPHLIPGYASESATLVSSLAGRSGSSSAVRVSAVVFIAALTAAAAQMSIPLDPVPFTLQPMIVLIGGACLGARGGAASQIIYLAAGAAGLPVFAHSPLLPQGFARLMGPTGGYLMAYPMAAFLVGWLAERGFDRRYRTAFVAMLAGLTVIFAGGVLWLGVLQPAAIGIGPALQVGFYPFVLVDLLKVALAAGAMPAMWRLFGEAASRPVR